MKTYAEREYAIFYGLSLAHKARFLSLVTEILSSVVGDENAFLACLILKIVVSEKIFYMCFGAQEIFVASDENLRPQPRKLSS